MQFIFSHHLHHPPFLEIIHIFRSLKKIVEIYLTLVPHLPISCLLPATVNHCQFLMCPSRIYIYIYTHTHTHKYIYIFKHIPISLFFLPQKRRCRAWRGAHCFFHLPIFLGGPFHSSTQRACLLFFIAALLFIIWMYIIYLFIPI